MKNIILVAGILSAIFTNAFAQSAAGRQQPDDNWVVFKSKRFDRTSGSPNKYTERITLPIKNDIPFVLEIENGEHAGKRNRVSSAIIKLNDMTICSHSDFNQNINKIEREVECKGDNTLDITLNGKPGCYITIKCHKVILPIKPLVDCVQKNADGSYTAHFGYQNDNKFDVETSVGLLNLFYPPPMNRNQPTLFKSGSQHDVFTVIFREKALIWELRGRVAIATNNPALACSSVDTTSPSLSLSSPWEGLITSSSTVQVIGTVSDASAVAVAVNETNVAVTNGAFSSQVILQEGQSTITVVAKDASNNATTVVRNVRRDSTPPIIALTSPSDSLITNQSVVVISGTVTDATPVTLIINGQIQIVNADQSFQQTIALTEGSNTITITATDTVGNNTTNSRLVIQDLQSPIVDLQLPIDSTITNQKSVTISGTVTDEHLASLKINGNMIAVIPDGTYSESVSLTEGANTITLVAADVAGNVTTVSRVVIADWSAPTLTVSSPLDSTITNISIGTINGTVADVYFASLTIGGTPISVNPDGSFSTDVHLSEGPNAIAIIAIDKAGNISTITQTLILDTAIPTITVLSLHDSTITNQSSILISGTITDASQTIVSANGYVLPIASDGSFSGSIPLVEGSNLVSIVVTDAAGNLITAERMVRLDSAPPIVLLVSPIDSLTTKESSVTITGSVVDSTAITLIVQGITQNLNPDGLFMTEASLAEGLNSIIIVATDAAGNSTHLTRTVRMDSTPPSIVLTSPADRIVTNQTTIVLSGSISDSSSVIFTINGITIPINAYGSFVDTLLINEGKNYFTIVATDTVGNQTTIKRTVIRDTQAPTILIASPTTNTMTTDSLVSVIGSIIDSTQVSVNVNGGALAVDINGGFSLLLFLSNGNNAISVVATDQAGNTSIMSRNVSKVSPPPDPEIVAPPVDTTVSTLVVDATEFLYKGTDPVQKGVAPGAINKIQVTVLRGRVVDKEMQPLSGTKVTILGKPELGYTFSREDGMYDIAANGGGEVNINFEKVGYLPAQRQVTTSWATYSSVDDVVLIQLDTVVHRVDFTQPEVVQGTPATDSLGTRKPALFFHQGTQAKLVFRTHSYRVIQGCVQIFQGIPYPEPPITITTPVDSLVEAKSINVRATEYSVGTNGEIAMPAKLPETVSYTFAFELTADEMLSTGARDVRFNQPVSLYLENVMNFPVGLTVPMGYYNREKGFWETSDNGRVIKILSTSGGIAAIDYNGDGVAEPADTLTGKGISFIEQQYLASTYSAGQSLWRAEITHLGTFAGGFGMIAANTVYPQNPLPDRYAKVDRDNIVAGSVIGVQNQTLGESIPITNAPLTMSYKSDRVFGRREAYCIDIPLTGNLIPQGMSKVQLSVEIVGKAYDFEFAPQANLTYHFEWDGKDAYGRRVQGQQNILTAISYCYPAQYSLPPDLRKCFATPSGQIMQQYIPARKEIKRTQIWEGKIGAFDMLSLGIGGWSLSLHHGYDCVGRILYKGTGDVRSANVMDNVINTIAGLPNGKITNKCYPSEWVDGKTAAQSKIGVPMNLLFAPDGSLYYREDIGNIIRIDSAGRMSTIAGKHGGCSTGLPDTATNIAANCANFFSAITGMTQGPDKSLYLSTDRNVIWRITPDGEIIRFAGMPYDAGSYGGSHKFAGDGGPALNAYLGWPWALAFGKDGCLYAADRYNCRIRKISPDGTITTVAGTGVSGSAGDGGSAVSCTINEPYGLTVAPDGSILFCDYGSHRVRKITPDGIVKPFAGNGNSNYANTGDGGPALQARLQFPNDISIAKDGTTFIASGNKIRGVATDGYIKTIVGGGNTVWLENGPATSAAIGYWSVIKCGPDGNLYIGEVPWPPATPSGSRIFKVTPPLPSITLSEILIASEDGSERYVFTYSGRHLRTLDALTGVVKYSFGYDSNYKLMTITDIDSLVTHIERDASGKATAIISPYGVRTQLNLDSLGYLLQAVNPASESRQFTYTDGGLMTSMTDARGNTYRYEYDSLGYLTRDLDPVGGYTNLTRTYDTLGYTIKAITAMGKKTTYRSEKSADGTRRFYNIDPNGLKTITVDSTDGSSYTITPEGMNRPTTEKPDPRFGMQSPLVNATAKTPGGLQSNINQFRKVTQMTGIAVTGLQDSISVNGKAFKTNYDGNARILTKTSAEGRKTFSFFDAKGRIVKDSIPELLATTYKYDSKGRKIEDNQGGRKTKYAYDSLGRQSNVTDPYNRITQFFYDSGDRLVKTILPDLSDVSFTYDRNGNVTAIKPPSRPEHKFNYSSVDLETMYTPPFVGDSARATSKIYTLDKEPWKVLRPDSLNITLEYGGKGSLVGYPKKIYFDRGALINIFDTTKAQLISVVTPNGDTLKFVYDGTLLKKVTWTGQNGLNSLKGNVAFTYNNDLQISTETVLPIIGSADSINLKYDKDGLLTSVGTLKLKYGVTNSMLLSDTLEGIITKYTYTPLGELASKETKYGSNIVLRLEYARDSIGRITEVKETKDGIIQKINYSYNITGRLCNVWKNDTLFSTYIYDPNGNRLGHITPTAIDSGSYDAQDRLITYGNIASAYTANGDLRFKTVGTDTTKYFYDAFGSLRSVKLSNGTYIEYLIDGSGRRVGKKSNGMITNKWLYSSDLRIVAELDSVDKITSRFIYTSRVNEPEYVIKNGIIYRIVTDNLGSLRQVINATTGNIVQQINYDEYGKILVDSNPGFTPFGYAGGIYDFQTNLVKFGSRDYDAEFGRWTKKDPIGFGGMDGNQYGYVGQDPINFTDPNGFWGGDQHRELTRNNMKVIKDVTSSEARMKGGFTPEEEKWAEDANVAQDDFFSSSNSDRFHGTGDMSAVLTVASAYMSLAICFQMIDEIFGSDQKAAMTCLGKGLHTLQDAPAHQGYGSGVMIWLNHAKSNPSPDNNEARPTEYKQAAKISKCYIQYFLEGK